MAEKKAGKTDCHTSAAALVRNDGREKKAGKTGSKSGKKKSSARVTEKQKRFVLEYLIDYNGTQAAIRAGYAPASAGSQAFDLLKKPHIQRALEKEKKKQVERLNLQADRPIEELKKIAFQTITDYMAFSDGSVVVVGSEQLTPDQAAAVANVRMGKYGVELEFYDKIKALEMLCKILGLFEKAEETEKKIVVELGDAAEFLV